MTDENSIQDDLREVLGENGYIGFSVKAKNTEENALIHSEFQAFAKAVSKNNYTKALGVLLENFKDDYRFSMLADEIQQLKERVQELEQRGEVQKKPEPGTF